MIMSREEQFLARHKVFLRQARDAAHHALFYLGFLYRSGHRGADAAVQQYQNFALHQAKGLIRAVYIRPAYKEEKDHLGQANSDSHRAAMGRAIEEWERWGRISLWFDSNEPDASNAEAVVEPAAVNELRNLLRGFLAATRSSGLLDRMVHHLLPDVLLGLRKRLTFILALLALTAVSLYLEMLRGLFWNEGSWMLLIVFLLILPIPILRLWPRRPPGGIRSWEIGELPFGFHSGAAGPAPMVPRWPSDAPILWQITLGQIVQFAIHGVLLFLTWLALNFLAPGSTSTVFIILALFYGVLYLANVLDFADFVSNYPVRMLGILIALAAIASLLLGAGRGFFLATLSLTGLACLVIYLRLSGRPGWLLIAVAALCSAAVTGLGGRTNSAEAWSDAADGQAWQHVRTEEWPIGPPPGSGQTPSPVVVVAASGGGSRAAMYTGLTLQALNSMDETVEIAENIQAISSVSGGSLANAAYLARLIPAHPSGQQERAELFKGLVDALADDFIYPTLQGALVPLMSRGRSIENYWETADVALGGITLDDVAREWKASRNAGAARPPFPLPLFNSATVDGYRVVITPFESQAYVNTAIHEHANKSSNYYQSTAYGADIEGDPFTWVYYRDQVYGLDQLLRSFNPRLSQAVRASANFPFGFPVVRVKTPEPLYFSPEPHPSEVKLTDGGVLSNSGFWSLYDLLTKNASRLIERGVFIVVIEASKMPERGAVMGTINELRGVIGDQAPIARNVHERMYDLLEQRFGSRLAIVQLDLPPRESKNIMTTWALDRGSVQILKESFNLRWNEEFPEIVRKWRRLKDGTGGGPLLDRRRVPVD